LLGQLYRDQFKKKPDELTDPLLKGDTAKQDPAAATESAITALTNELKGTVIVVDTDLRALGQRRAEAVRALLLEGTSLDPARVFITAESPAAVEQGKVRMELALR
jgi:ribosomal protein S11